MRRFSIDVTIGNIETRTYHHGQLRQAALDATIAALASSADDLSLRKLARDVGVSHAALYRHFRSKDALLSAVAAEGFARLCDRLTEAGRAAADPDDTVRASAVAYVEFALDNPALYTLMFGPRIHGDDSAGQLPEQRQRCFRLVLGGVQRAAGCTRREANAHTTRLWTMLHGYCALMQVQRLPRLARSVTAQARELIEPVVASWSRPDSKRSQR